MNLLQQLEQEQSYIAYLQDKHTTPRNTERIKEQIKVVRALEETIRKVENALVVNWD